MKFEDAIRKISAFTAGFVVFFVAAGMYLSFKGFVRSDDGTLVLVRNAEARKNEVKVSGDINSAILPENHVLGKENAPIAIYEYSSLGCYHCADFHGDVLPKLKKDYIDKGKVKLIFADFPLDKRSMRVSVLARCFEDSGKYYDFIDLMFRKQREWSLASSSKFDQLITNYAMMNGLSEEEVKKCMKNDDVAKELADIRMQGIEKVGITGTPSFLIVHGKDRQVIEGAPKYLELKKVIEDKLTNK